MSAASADRVDVAPTRLDFRPDIEGLRALAILLVVLYHAEVPGFSGGYVGVDVFFVLSGYLITRLLVSEAESSGRVSFASFYARRFRRLMPASAIVLVTSLVLSLLLYSPLELRSTAKSAAAVSLYVSNVLFARESTDYLAAAPTSNPFLHTWSLAVEEQFYLVWPAILLVLFLLGRRWQARRGLTVGMVVMSAFSFLACVGLTASNQPWAFYLAPPRFWEFAVGGVAALLGSKSAATQGRPMSSSVTRALALGGLFLVLGAGVAFDARTAFPGPMAMVPVLGTTMLLVAGSSTRGSELATGRMLGAPVMQWLGARSYSWYLWHWPLLVFLIAVFPDAGVVAKTAAVVVALGLSAVTFVAIERPARESRWFRLRPGASIVGGLGLAVVCLLLSLVVGRYASTALLRPDQTRFAAAVEDTPGLVEKGCSLGFLTPLPSEPCVFGDPDSETTVVLLGDSHAAHWFPAMEDVARENGWRLLVYTKASCPGLDLGPIHNSRLGRTYVECSEWREEVTKRIIAERPSLVVMSNSSNYASQAPRRTMIDWGVASPDEWKEALRRSAESYQRNGIPLAVITDVPLPPSDVPVCLSRQEAAPVFTGSCAVVMPRDENTVVRSVEREALEGMSGTTIVDMNDVICPRASCPTERDGMILYSDSNHMTATFSRSLADELSARLEPLLR